MDSDAVVTLARDLIRAPSPSRREGPAAAVVLRALRQLPFDEVRQDEAGVKGRLAPREGAELT